VTVTSALAKTSVDFGPSEGRIEQPHSAAEIRLATQIFKRTLFTKESPAAGAS
jgi:hypothetical protein